MGYMNRVKGKVLAAYSSVTQFGRGGSLAGMGGNLQGAQFAGAAGNGADTSEDVLYTFSLPGSSLDSNNRQLYIYAWGAFAGNADTKTARLYFGTQLIAATGTASGTSWALEMVVAKSAANVQRISAQTILGVSHGGVANITDTETDTAAIVIKVTGQASAANQNDVILQGVVLQGSN